jgi:hypothetical protein
LQLYHIIALLSSIFFVFSHFFSSFRFSISPLRCSFKRRKRHLAFPPKETA